MIDTAYAVVRLAWLGTGLIVWSLIILALMYLLGVAMYVGVCALVMVIRCWCVCVEKVPARNWLRAWWEFAKDPPDLVVMQAASGGSVVVHWPFTALTDGDF